MQNAQQKMLQSRIRLRFRRFELPHVYIWPPLLAEFLNSIGKRPPGMGEWGRDAGRRRYSRWDPPHPCGVRGPEWEHDDRENEDMWNAPHQHVLSETPLQRRRMLAHMDFSFEEERLRPTDEIAESIDRYSCLRDAGVTENKARRTPAPTYLPMRPPSVPMITIGWLPTACEMQLRDVCALTLYSPTQASHRWDSPQWPHTKTGRWSHD